MARTRQTARKSVRYNEARFAQTIQVPTPPRAEPMSPRIHREEIQRGKRLVTDTAGSSRPPSGPTEGRTWEQMAEENHRLHARLNRRQNTIDRLRGERRFWSQRIIGTMGDISTTADHLGSEMEFPTTEDESSDGYTPISPLSDYYGVAPTSPLNEQFPHPPAFFEDGMDYLATRAGENLASDELGMINLNEAAEDPEPELEAEGEYDADIEPEEGFEEEESEEEEEEEEDPEEMIEEEEDEDMYMDDPIPSSPSLMMWSPSDEAVEVVNISSDDSYP